MDEPFAGVDASTEKAIITLLKEMKQQGKTVIVVHHDLQTATNYFDWLVLMNTRLIAAGALQDVFTQEKLDQTYGGKLNILAQVGDIMQQKSYPVREKE
jgi:manganese/zinc/iron transport system ATP- binding protein